MQCTFSSIPFMLSMIDLAPLRIMENRVYIPELY